MIVVSAQQVTSSISTMTFVFNVQFGRLEDIYVYINGIRVREGANIILVIDTPLTLLYQYGGTSQSYTTATVFNDQTCLQEDDWDGSPLIYVQIGK